MRLTNTIRDAFINSVMQDVPKVDHSEAIRKLVVDDIVSRLPAKVRAVWDDKDLRHWITTDYSHWGGISVSYPAAEKRSWRETPTLSTKVFIEVEALVQARNEQSEMQDRLESKLKAAAYGCTTRKQLAELLPEFAHYLPADEGAALTKNLPAVANMVAEFTKAGWPKDKEVAA